MGPLLFLLYLNDLPDNISSDVRLFADDCVLYRKIESENDRVQLQLDLDRLNEWQHKWQMRFNAEKCFTLKISHTKKNSHCVYKLGESVLKEVKSHSYLGITISHDLKWGEHIDTMVNKANRVLGVIRRNLHSCPTKLKATAYISLVRPHLEYSSTVWDPATNNLIDKLEAVQRKAARFVCRDYRPTSSVTDMLAKLNWDSLQMRRTATRLTMLHKITNDQVAIPASTFLQPVPRLTRLLNQKAFIRPHAKKDCYNKSFFPRTIAEWNYLPDHLVNTNDTKQFKESVTNYLRTTTQCA